MQTRRSVLVALSGALTLPGFSARASDYPSSPIKIIVSFPAGGSIDVVMRAMAAPLQARLGKPIVIENRAGAAGVVAEGAVAKADPDGLTLLADASALAANPTLFKSMPFDTLKDLQPVYLMFRTPLALVVNPDVPARSVKELIATMTGTTMTGVAYRGAPLALNDVIAGRVALMFADAGSVTGQIKSEQVRALGVRSTERVPALPDIPTIAETGVQGFEAVGWTLVCAPAATPKPILDTLSAAFGAATEAPEVHALMLQLGTLPVKSPSPAELKPWLAAEIDRWGKLVERAGVAKSL
jgi:tripartite-type tricarboxylate transporter receptor subunit TctC